MVISDWLRTFRPPYRLRTNRGRIGRVRRKRDNRLWRSNHAELCEDRTPPGQVFSVGALLAGGYQLSPALTSLLDPLTLDTDSLEAFADSRKSTQSDVRPPLIESDAQESGTESLQQPLYSDGASLQVPISPYDDSGSDQHPTALPGIPIHDSLIILPFSGNTALSGDEFENTFDTTHQLPPDLTLPRDPGLPEQPPSGSSGGPGGGDIGGGGGAPAAPINAAGPVSVGQSESGGGGGGAPAVSPPVAGPGTTSGGTSSPDPTGSSAENRHPVASGESTASSQAAHHTNSASGSSTQGTSQQPGPPIDPGPPTNLPAEPPSDTAYLNAATFGQSILLDAHGVTLEDVFSFRTLRRPEQNMALPYGLFGFTIPDVQPGGSVTVDVVLPEGQTAETYFKEDPATGELYRFEYDGQTGAVIEGNVITLYLVDGERGDADGLANGVIVDPGGPGAGVVTVDCGGANGLEGWTVTESGGTQNGAGSVVHEEDHLVIREGDSFIVTLERQITIPSTPSILTLDYTGTFDTTDPDFINDAFEVALLDDQLHSVVPETRYQRDVYFNLTEEEPAALGTGTLHFPDPDQVGTNTLDVSGTVDLDISGLAVGSTYTLVFRLVNDDEDTGTTFRIACAGNEPPTATADTYSLSEDTTLTVTAAGVLTNDTDPESDPLTAVKVTDPANGTVTLNADGSLTYTPNADFHGEDTFTYKANDGTADSNVATVTITVDPVNDAPVAADDGYSVNEDATLTVAAAGVLTNDSDVDGDAITVDLSSVTGPANGTLTPNADGSFTYTPNANFNGTDTFTYKAKDPSLALSNVATVTITVNPVNDAPVAVNDTYSVNEDTVLTVAAAGVLTNDSDVDGDALTVDLASVTGPSNGTLTLNADGSFTYTPDANFHGTDTFTYKANDGALDSNVATVTITVNPVNDAPVAVDDGYSVNEDTTLTVAAAGVLTNDSDVDGDAITSVLVSGPSNGTLTLNANGSFTYTPDANYNGTDSFTYKANDGALDSNNARVTITVNPINDAPLAVNDSFSVNEDTTLTVTAGGVLTNDGDVDGDAITSVLVSSPSNGTLTLNANGSFTYTPNANYNGTDTFTYKANDGALDSNVATVTITVNPVNDAPIAIDDSYSTNEDTELTVAAAGVLTNDSDVDGDAITAILVSGPSSGTLTLNANGSFTYTPNADYNGTDNFTYKANDGALDSNVATVTITVNPVNDAPVAVNDAYSVKEDTVLTIAAAGVLGNDGDVDGDTITSVLVSGPSSGTLTLNANGSFTYTPNANFNGTDTFTYKANDGALDSNNATVTITVSPVNDPPDALDDGYSVNEDTTLNVAAAGVLSNDSDLDGDPLTAVLISGPSSGTLSLNANGSFTYTPNADFHGSDSFLYKANDGTLDSKPATVTITVNPVNDAPLAVNDAYSTDEDTALTVAAIGVLTNDSDVDGDALTVDLASVTGPSNGTLTLNADGSFTYTPNADYNGTDTFTYKANDGALDSNVATATITVNPVNDAPVAVNDGYSVNEDTALTVAAAGVLTNDSDVDGDALTSVLVSGPSNGTLTLNANGSFTYTPNANYNGTDTFTYKANDGALDSNVATVTITVNSVNDAPVAVNDGYSVNEDTTLTVAVAGVLTNDSDVDGDAITSVLVAGPSNGSLTFNADGSFTYTPNADYNGTDTFTYKANDGALDSNVATVTITVNPVNDPPVAVNDGYSVNEDTTLTVAAAGVLTNDSDVDGDALSATLLKGPSNGTLTLNANGSFTYTPNTNFHGSDTFKYKANDGALDSSEATVTITVDPVNDAPVAVDDAYEIDEDTTLTVAAAGVLTNDSDVDGDAITSVLVAGPSNGTLTLNANGSFTYTPNLNFNGDDTFTYKANDGALDSVTAATVTITVKPINDAATVSTPALSSDEGQTVNLSADFTDPETSDTHTAVIDWGDGSPAETGVVSESGGSGTVIGSHIYADNGNYTVTVTVTDNHGAEDSDSDTAAVTNVAPSLIAGFGFTAAETQVGGKTEQLPAMEVTGRFTDPGFTKPAAGTQETFTVTLDWGDGTTPEVVPAAVVQGSEGVLSQGTFTAQHAYTQGGYYTVTATVADDDGGTDSATGFTFAVLEIRVDPRVNIKKGTGANARVPVDVYDDGRAGNDPQHVDLSRINTNSIQLGPAGAPLATANSWKLLGNGNAKAHFYRQDTGLRDTDKVTFMTGWIQDEFGNDETIFIGADWWLKDPHQNPLPDPVPVGPSRFFVADAGDQNMYRYDSSGAASGVIVLDTAAKDVRGTTIWGGDPNDFTDAILWSVGGSEQVAIQKTDGVPLGSWRAFDVRNPQGIASDGQDVWIVDTDTNEVLRYNGMGINTSFFGVGVPGFTFALDAANASPTGITTDGEVLWVVDDAADKVFVYDPAGTLLGSWSIDPANGDPAGITRALSNASLLWIVDRADKTVYKYSGATQLRDGSKTASNSFALADHNVKPEGIADPHPENIPPTAMDDSYTDVPEGFPTDLFVLDNDWDDDFDPLTIISVGTPTDGTVEISFDGTYLTYTGNAGYSSDSFTYTIDDGHGGTSTATVTVSAPVNNPPTAMDDELFDVSTSFPTDIFVLDNDSDPEFDLLTIISVTTPTSGTADISIGGDYVTYTPGAGFTTTDSFQYTIDDGNGNTATATVTLNAYQNQPPTAMDDEQFDVSVTFPTDIFVLDNDMDPEFDILTITSTTTPTYGTVSISAGGDYLTYTPTAGFEGNTESFQYTISDGQGNTSSATVTLYAAANFPPQALDDEVDSAPVGIPVDVYVLDNDYDPEFDVLTITAVTTPASGTAVVSASGDYITYTAGAGFSGDSFQYTVSDSSGKSATATVTVPNWQYDYTYDDPEAWDWYYTRTEDADISTDSSALELAQAIADDPTWITGASFVTAPPVNRSAAVGTAQLSRFGSADGSTSYAILSTGEAALVNDPGESASFNLKGENVRGDNDYDVTILKIDLNVPAGVDFLAFDFQYFTEEFPNFVDITYNDAFLAELDNSTWTTAGGVITAPDNFATFPNGNSVSVAGTGYAELSRDRAAGTSFDGGSTGNAGDTSGAATGLLHVQTPITAGAHSLYLSIFDQGDGAEDTAVLIDNLTLGTAGGAVTAGITNVLQLETWTVRNPFDAYTDVLISGRAFAANELASVTANGIPVEAIDASNRFFTTATALPGLNTFEIIATDVNGNTASSSEQFRAAVLDPDRIEYVVLSEASASVLGEYGETSFNEQPDFLFADIAVKNNGTYLLDAPLLVGVVNITDPTVRVREFDGVTPDGIPFFDMTELLDHGNPTDDLTLSPGESTEQTTISFYNPNRIPFHYDLVVLGRLNKPPRFITPPVVDGIVGQAYSYDSEAYDENQDSPLNYALLGGPGGLTIDAASGLIDWTPPTGSEGNHTVLIQVDDGRGGSDLQEYIITVTDPPANRPPHWTSQGITEAFVNIQYVYAGTAVDPDNDLYTFSKLDGPADLTINSTTGLVEWVPDAADVNLFHDVLLRVTDEHGLYEDQPYTIWVGPQPGNHPPEIITEPDLEFHLPGEANPVQGNVSPSQVIDLELDLNETFTQTVSITLGDPLGNPPPADPNSLNITLDNDAQSLVSTLLSGSEGMLVTSQQLLAPPPLEEPEDPMDPESPMVLTAASSGSYTNTSTTYNLPDTGIVLSSGNAEDYEDGPNTTEDFSWDFGNLATPDQENLLDPITGGTFDHYDVTQLDITFDLLPGYDTVYFDVVFGSDEFPEWRLSQFIDAFGIYVNGQNIAQVDSLPINVDHPDMHFVQGTELDGVLAPGGIRETFESESCTRTEDPATCQDVPDGVPGNPVVTFSAFVGDGALNNTLTFIVADSGDGIYDTTVYLSSLSATPPKRDIEVIPSDPTAPAVNLTGIVADVQEGATTNFDVQFTGDDTARVFDLLFVDANTGVLYGSIPVTMNVDYHYDVDAIDPDDDPVTYRFLPGTTPDASIDAVTGLLDWEPIAGGTYHFEIEAADGRGGTDVQIYDVEVKVGQPNQAPSISSTSPTQAAAGRTLAYQVVATDPDEDQLQYFLTADAPAGMQINRYSGLLTWTPTANQVQGTPYTPKIQVRDGRGGLAEQPLSIMVVSQLGNTPPVISMTAPASAIVGKLYTFDADATDAEFDLLAWDLPVYPIGMEVDLESGVVVWRPTPDQAGRTFDAILRVRDGRGGVDLEQFRVTVAEKNTPPTFVSTAPAGPAVVGYTYTYQTEIVEPNGDPVTYTITGIDASDPTNVLPVNDPGDPNSLDIDANGKITWKPAAAHDGKTFTITTVANDGQDDSLPHTFQLLVATEVANGAPTITTTSLPGPAGVGLPYRTQIEATDPENEPLTFFLDDAPAGMVINPTTGVIDWTPTASDVATHTIVVSVRDTSGHRVGKSFSLEVQSAPANNPPAINTTTLPGPAAVNLRYLAQIDATDPDGDLLTYAAVASDGVNPDITLNVSADGLIDWTPTVAGNYSITVTVDDNRPGGVTTTSPPLSLTVDDEFDAFTNNQPPTIDAPTVANFPSPVAEGLPFQVQIEASDPNGDEFTFSLDQAPTGMSIDADGLITWPDPTLTLPGFSHTISVSVDDGRGGFDQRDYSFEVISGVLNNKPTIHNEPRTKIRTGRTYLYPVDATDPDGDAVTITLETGPAGMTLENGNVVKWSTTVDDLGFHDVIVKAADPRGEYELKKFQIEVVSLSSNTDSEITSQPPSLNAVVGQEYRYEMTAIDAEDDPREWELVQGPNGVSVHRLLGVLTWTPTSDQLGPQEITVRVVDPYGGEDTQLIPLTVRAVNLAPFVTSTAPSSGVTDQEYVYQVRAVDPEGGPLSYTVSGVDSANNPLPANDPGNANALNIDSGGLLRWTPTAVDTYTVTVTITDNQGEPFNHRFEITVTDAAATDTDKGPYYTAVPQPPVEAPVAEQFNFLIQARDPEKDPITYALTEEPTYADTTSETDRMKIDTDGRITWTPTDAQLNNGNNGKHFVTVTATANGKVASYRFQILVTPENIPPEITFISPAFVTAGNIYRYDVIVENLDFDPLTYMLQGSTPKGMEIDRYGRISWPTATADAGAQYTFNVLVSDGHPGGEDSEQITLTVNADTELPKLDLQYSPTNPVVDAPITFLVSATDNVGITERTLSLNDGANTFNVPLDDDGFGTFTPGTFGDFTINANATDAAGNTRTLPSTTITVRNNDPNAPTLSITSPDKDGTAGSDDDGMIVTAPINVVGSVTDSSVPSDLLSYKLEVFTIDGKFIRTITDVSDPGGAVIADFSGTFGTFDPTLLKNGTYLLRLTATDAALNVSQLDRIVNVDGNLKLGNFELSFTDLTVPVAGIPITITRSYDTLQADEQGDFGYGWKLDFANYEIETDYGPGPLQGFGGYPSFRVGTRVVVTQDDGTTEGFTFQPRPESRFFGLITVWHPRFIPDKGVTSFLTAKDAELTLIPETGEFISWKAGGISYNPINPVFGGTYNHFSLDGFQRTIDAESGEIESITERHGNKLTFKSDSIESNRGRAVNIERDSKNRITRITDPRGNFVSYTYDKDGNLTSVTDRMGNFTTDPTDGITTFEYITAPQNYIGPHYLSKIVDPLGQETIQYRYNADGRVDRMTDAASEIIDIVYDLRDPSTYNANDLSTLPTQTVTDQLGNPATTTYDTHGNVVQEFAENGSNDATVGRTFENPLNPLAMTSEFHVVGVVDSDPNRPVDDPNDILMLLDYYDDELGMVKSQTKVIGQKDDPANGESDDIKTIITYNDAGQITSTTDALGNSTQFYYGFEGGLFGDNEFGQSDLVATTNPADNTSFFEYDAHGNVTKVTTGAESNNFLIWDILYGGFYEAYYDPDCDYTIEEDPACEPMERPELISTTFEYNEFGDRVKSTDPLGNVNTYTFNENGDRLAVNSTVTTPQGVVNYTSSTAFDAEGRPVSQTDPEGHPRTYEYNIASDLIAMVDPRGGRTDFTFDERGIIVGVSDPGQNNYTTVVNAAGRAIEHTKPSGHTTKKLYDSLGRVTELIFPDDTPLDDTDNPSVKTEYDNAGRVIAQIDENGNRTEYEYDEADRQILIRDPQLNETHVIYDSAGRVISQTDPTGHTTQFRYDAGGNLIETISDGVVIQSATYDLMGRQTSETDANGNTTSYEYDKMGRVTAIIDALGRSSQTEYNEAGFAVKNIAATGEVTEYEFDGMGRVTAMINEAGARATFVHDAAGNVISATSFSGSTVTSEYDANNRVIAQHYDDGTSKTYTYDVSGQLVSVTDRLGRTTTQTYDERGRLLSVTDHHNNTKSFTYDDYGNKLTETDALQSVTSFSYDAMNRLTSVTDANLGSTTYTYDVAGHLKTVTDASNNTTTYAYDDQHRLLSETNQLGDARTFEYDPAGNRTKVTDRNGRVRTFEYDAVNRLTSEKWLDASSNVIYTATYTFDTPANGGRLLSVSDPNSTYSYTYDTFGRIDQIDNAGTPGVPNVVLTQAYDSSGNRTSLSATINGVADFSNTYTYDAFNRMIRIEQSGITGGNTVSEKRVDMAYDPIGQFTSIDRYSDLAGTNLVVSSTYSYDTLGRLTSLAHSDGTTTLANYSYTYDGISRITQFLSPDGSSTYTYDDASQLTTTTHSFQADESYSYDLTGNRTITGYQTGANNRLLSDGTFNYDYDAEGNRIRRTEIATGEVTEYNWDHRNRLTRVVTKDSSGNITHTVDYTYDFYDRRIAKKVDADGDGPAAAQEEHFVYDGENIILSFDGAGQLEHRYLHGPAVDQFFADEDALGNVLWGLGDLQGSVRDVVDNSGTVVNHIIYDAYGNITGQSSPVIEVRFKFTGREFDEETGLYFYRARYYDQTNGRFLSEDPLGFDGGDTNLTRYVLNNPVNLVDPSGTSYTMVMGGFGGSWGRFKYDAAVIAAGQAATLTLATLVLWHSIKLLWAMSAVSATSAVVTGQLYPGTDIADELARAADELAQLGNQALDAIRDAVLANSRAIVVTIAFVHAELIRRAVNEYLRHPCKYHPPGLALSLWYVDGDHGDRIPIARFNKITSRMTAGGGTGTRADDAARAFVVRQGRGAAGGDDAGHLQGKQLGGLGELHQPMPNIVPQDAGINQGRFNAFERRIKARITNAEGRCILVTPTYSEAASPVHPNRPVAIPYTVFRARGQRTQIDDFSVFPNPL